MRKDYIQEIITKLDVSNWAIVNPTSAKEISDFLTICLQTFEVIPGFIRVLKSISQELENKDSIKWLNYLSQLRCAYFLHSKGVCVTSFEKKNLGKVVDLELNGGILCEIKSFEATLNSSKSAIQWEEFVFNNFLNNKLIPAFIVQKADLVIIDDIFSYESKNYRFLNYFLSFIDSPGTDRYDMLQSKLGKYLPKIMILSFTQSMVINPTIRLVGKQWNNLENKISS